MTNRVFEKYEIIKRIAVGGMGEVFLARQLGAAKFERQVILKAMLNEKATPLLASRFLDEARLVATLNHPNVVSVFEAGLSNGTFYMAMEYIAGWNLAQLQREAEANRTELPLGLVVRVVHDAALGLDHAHQAVDAQGQLQQLVHRDVSPHNIMLRRDGVTKVVDFGVAWALNREAKTQTGAVVGKVAYMAPEQLMGEVTDARTDQFALGVVAWELLTRRRLHSAANELEIAKLVLTSRIAHPSDVEPRLPRELGEVVVRMLADAPDRRFARLQDVAIELDRISRVLHLDTSHATLEAFLAPWLPVPAERVEETGSDFVVQLRPQAPPERATPASHSARESHQHTRQLPAASSVRARAVVGMVTLVAAVGLSAWFLMTRAVTNSTGDRTVGPPDGAVIGQVQGTGDATAGIAIDEAARDGGAPVAAVPDPTARDGATSDVGATGVASATVDAGLVAAATKPAPKKGLKTKKTKQPPPNEPVARVEDARPGVLNLDTDPWSKVYVDGRFIGSTPISTEIRSGPHDLVLVNAERALRKQHHFKLAAGETLKLKLALEQLAGAP